MAKDCALCRVPFAGVPVGAGANGSAFTFMAVFGRRKVHKDLSTVRSGASSQPPNGGKFSRRFWHSAVRADRMASLRFTPFAVFDRCGHAVCFPCAVAHGACEFAVDKRTGRPAIDTTVELFCGHCYRAGGALASVSASLTDIVQVRSASLLSKVPGSGRRKAAGVMNASTEASERISLDYDDPYNVLSPRTVGDDVSVSTCLQDGGRPNCADSSSPPTQLITSEVAAVEVLIQRLQARAAQRHATALGEERGEGAAVGGYTAGVLAEEFTIAVDTSSNGTKLIGTPMKGPSNNQNDKQQRGSAMSRRSDGGYNVTASASPCGLSRTGASPNHGHTTDDDDDTRHSAHLVAYLGEPVDVVDVSASSAATYCDNSVGASHADDTRQSKRTVADKAVQPNSSLLPKHDYHDQSYDARIAFGGASKSVDDVGCQTSPRTHEPTAANEVATRDTHTTTIPDPNSSLDAKQAVMSVGSQTGDFKTADDDGNTDDVVQGASLAEPADSGRRRSAADGSRTATSSSEEDRTPRTPSSQKLYGTPPVRSPRDDASAASRSPTTSPSLPLSAAASPRREMTSQLEGSLNRSARLRRMSFGAGGGGDRACTPTASAAASPMADSASLPPTPALSARRVSITDSPCAVAHSDVAVPLEEAATAMLAASFQRSPSAMVRSPHGIRADMSAATTPRIIGRKASGDNIITEDMQLMPELSLPVAIEAVETLVVEPMDSVVVFVVPPPVAATMLEEAPVQSSYANTLAMMMMTSPQPTPRLGNNEGVRSSSNNKIDEDIRQELMATDATNDGRDATALKEARRPSGEDSTSPCSPTTATEDVPKAAAVSQCVPARVGSSKLFPITVAEATNRSETVAPKSKDSGCLTAANNIALATVSAGGSCLSSGYYDDYDAPFPSHVPHYLEKVPIPRSRASSFRAHTPLQQSLAGQQPAEDPAPIMALLDDARKARDRQDRYEQRRLLCAAAACTMLTTPMNSSANSIHSSLNDTVGAHHNNSSTGNSNGRAAADPLLGGGGSMVMRSRTSSIASTLALATRQPTPVVVPHRPTHMSTRETSFAPTPVSTTHTFSGSQAPDRGNINVPTTSAAYERTGSGRFIRPLRVGEQLPQQQVPTPIKASPSRLYSRCDSIASSHNSRYIPTIANDTTVQHLLPNALTTNTSFASVGLTSTTPQTSNPNTPGTAAHSTTPLTTPEVTPPRTTRAAELRAAAQRLKAAKTSAANSGHATPVTKPIGSPLSTPKTSRK